MSGKRSPSPRSGAITSSSRPSSRSIVFFDGYDNFNPSYVIHYVSEPWHLRPGQAGLLVSSGLFGFMISALVAGSDLGPVRAPHEPAHRPLDCHGLQPGDGALRELVSHVLCLSSVHGPGARHSAPGVRDLHERGSPRGGCGTHSPRGDGRSASSRGAVAASIVGVFLTPRFGWPVLFYLGSLLGGARRRVPLPLARVSSVFGDARRTCATSRECSRG